MVDPVLEYPILGYAKRQIKQRVLMPMKSIQSDNEVAIDVQAELKPSQLLKLQKV